MTTLYLAMGGALKPLTTAFTIDPPPPALCSYVYYKTFGAILRNETTARVRNWVLDSGAFSAKNSGFEIKLQEYIDFCKSLQGTPAEPSEVFALDVIGDWRASMANTEEMWRQGVEATPCFHVGEPASLLRSMAADYPKIAIGGTVGLLQGNKRIQYLEQCFARIWPKKVHGFGMTGPEIMNRIPFHSVDATSWEIAPLRYGNWKAYGPSSGIRKSHDLRPEVRWYMNLEARIKARWAKEMAQLSALPHVTPPLAQASLGATP